MDVLLKSIVFIHMVVDTYSGESCPVEIVLGNYARHMNEIMAPEDGEHDFQNMLSEI